MRFVLPLLLVALVLGAVVPVSVADDEPAAEPKKPIPATPLRRPGVVEVDPAEPKEEAEEGWSPDSHWFTKLLTPTEVWPVITAKVRKAPRARMRYVQSDLIKEYLEVWHAAEKDPASLDAEELQALLRLYTVASEYGKALDTIHVMLAAEELEVQAKDAAMASLASLLGNTRGHALLGEEALASMADLLRAHLGERAADPEAAKLRGQIHQSLARYATSQEDDEAAMRHNVLSAMEDPSKAASVGRMLVRSLQSSTHDMEGYETLRTTMAAILPVLQRQAALHLESVKDSDDARMKSYAERGVKMLETAGRPIEMLGRPVQAWTLERAYGDVKALSDLRGKVVILDFWATWCPWCIKSFPAIRDLLRDYDEKDLAIVGVTASASSVYEHRYDLDDDLKDKGDGKRAQAVARLARGTRQPDPEKGYYAEAEFREKEQAALEKFIQNHEMTWPVVMIDKEEPGPKYAVGGWPHAVVLDREGRIRYFKVGALLRDREEAVAAFRAVLDDLIAETKAEPAAAETTDEPVEPKQ